MADLPRILSVSRGDLPADCVLGNGRIINVFTGEIERADIAIADGMIAGIGAGYAGKQAIDLKGSFIAPGLIDAHVHIESSLCLPAEFAKALLPRGVTSVVADPHEIANVAGINGIYFMADKSVNLPLNVVLMAPSCVPATALATTDGVITEEDIRQLREGGCAHGLAEVMNFPSAIAGDASMLRKIGAMRGCPVDGHAPAVIGKPLNAYIAAGVGSDHECTSITEAHEKLSRGMYVLIREATNARNLDALLPVITASNGRRICFCTDDRTPVDLLSKGSVDEMVRRAIAFGIAPVEAIRMATLNTAEWFGLTRLGAIAPGRQADLFVFDELQSPTARLVFAKGIPHADVSCAPVSTAAAAGQSKIDWERIRFDVPAKSERLRVIGCVPDQLLTEHRILRAKISDGKAVSDVSADVLKMLVIERHRGSGNHSAGFIQGFALKSGAIAGTVAHDHHNLVVIGADDESMKCAARAVAETGGGLAVAVGEQVIASLPLPVAGLMSDRPIAEVAERYASVVTAARGLGSTLPDPFMAMSFMTLEVIPALKLTDRGLVDVEKFGFVELFV